MALRRFLGLLVLLVGLLAAGPARAEDGMIPPATDGTRQALADQYPPDSLQFYTDSASWYQPTKQMKNGVTTIVSAFFSFEASVVKWTVRAVDYAWNFNLARWFGGLVDSVMQRISLVVWSFGGVLCTFIGVWVALQVWNGGMSRMMGGLAVFGIVLALAIVTRAGLSGLVADLEDIGSDVAAQVLTAGAVGDQPEGGLVSMTDGVYRQLILEQWARANFSSLEAAQKYEANGLPGGKYLGLPEEQAQAQFDRDHGSKNPDLEPWFEDGALGHRIGVVLETGLSMLLFLPILFLLAVLVLGTKGLGLFFVMGFPVALFVASMPWLGGLRFLRGYIIWACIAPIVKVFCSVGLAFYMAFLAGLMGASKVVPGGWGTVTLLMGAIAVTMYLMGRPIIRLFTGLLGRKMDNQRSGAQAGVRPTSAPQERLRVRPAQGGGKRWATRTGRRLHVIRPGEEVRWSPQAKPVSGSRKQSGTRTSLTATGSGSSGRSRHFHELAKYAALRDAARRSPGRGVLPQYDLVDLLRETKRVMRAMANTVESGGRRS